MTTQTSATQPDIRHSCDATTDWLSPTTEPLVQEWAARHGAVRETIRVRQPDHYDVHPEDIQSDYEVPEDLATHRRLFTDRFDTFAAHTQDVERRRAASREGSWIVNYYVSARDGFRRGYFNVRAQLLDAGYSAAALDRVPAPDDALAAAWERGLEASRNAPDYD